MIFNSPKKLALLAVGAALVAGTVTAQPAQHQSTKNSSMSLTTPEGLKWVQIRQGNEMAVVYGDPTKAGELYAVRFVYRTDSRYRPTGIRRMSMRPCYRELFCLVWAKRGIRHS